MKTDLYLITTLTNLHVGSGDINFDIIDNQVQKDEITNYPIIHSSSLKGALREHFESRGESFVNYIFGGDGVKDESAGAYSFYEAKLLTRPVRSNVKPYFNATTPSIIKDLIDMIELLSIKTSFLDELKNFYEKIKNTKKVIVLTNENNVILEDIKATTRNDLKVDIPFLKDLAIFPHKIFKDLDLPVIARNKISKDGTSENLWYEEIVPSKSTFYFFISKPENIAKSDIQKVEQFNKSFENDVSIVQIGANKSIGYGVCQIKRISDE